MRSPRSWRHATSTTVLTVACAVATLALAATALRQDHPPDDPHAAVWLLTLLFAVAELEGLGVPRERRSLTSPASRIPLVVGLCLSAPLELLLAQQMGTALAQSGRARRGPRDTLFVLAGSGMATALGGWAYLALVDPLQWAGAGGWALNGALSAVVVVLTSTGLSWARHPSRGRAPAAVLRWITTPLVADGLAVATGLVVVQIISSDPLGAWLLLLPGAAAYSMKLRFERADGRAHALATLHDAARRVQRAPDVGAALSVAVEQARAVTGAGVAEIVLRSTADDVLTCRDDGHGTVPQARPATAEERRLWARLDAGGGTTRLTRDAADAVTSARRRHADGIVVPIIEHGAVTAFVRVSHRPGRRTFSPTEVGLLETLAASLGPPLETARLVDDLSVQHERDSEIKRELQRVSDAKSVFLATTSHELRAPLTALLAEAALLDRFIDQAGQVDVCRRLVDGVGENSRRLLRLVDDLLDLSRIEAGQLEMRDEHVDVAAVAADAVRALCPVARDEDVDLAFEAVGPVTMRADPDRLWQVVTNLTQNAITATPASGSVTVVVEAGTDGPRITVTDTGVGLTADQLERIFAPFEQVRPSHRGLGLGLTIARHIVEHNGGTLAATSSPGVGSRFTAQLVATGPAEPASPQTWGSHPVSG